MPFKYIAPEDRQTGSAPGENHKSGSMFYVRLHLKGTLFRITGLWCIGAALGCSSMTTGDRITSERNPAPALVQPLAQPSSLIRSPENHSESLLPQGSDTLTDQLLSATRFPNLRRSRVALTAFVKRVTSRGVALTFLLFDDRKYDIAVADKDLGPETEWQTAQASAIRHDAVAAINGGFFTPTGKPLGLVIEGGKRIGIWNSQSPLTSGLLSVEKSPRLLRRQHWRSFSPTQHLLQTGPFLVENDVEVQGLDDRERRPRSFIAWNGRNRWAFGVAEGATLTDLGSALAAQPLPGMNITTALNLDGGRSSDLWVSPEVSGGPVSTRRVWNRPVRNYLLLIPRHQE